MKILHIIKGERDKTVSRIMEAHRATHEVAVVDLKSDKDYESIVDRIAESDLAISW